MSTDPLDLDLRTRVVALFGAAAEDRIAAAREEMLNAEVADEAPGRRANQQPAAPEARKAWAKVVAEEEETAARVTLTELTARQRAQLLDDCPPREKVSTDRLVGYDQHKMWWDSLRAMMTDPVYDDEQWERFAARLSEANANLLSEAMNELREGADVPKSSVVSAYLESRTD